MDTVMQKRQRWVTPVSVFAIFFGLLTLKEGGSVLFFDGAARKAAGDYVPFVLWFNFCAGFAYIGAGAGLWRTKRWSAYLAIIIAASTMIVSTALGIHILQGGAFELRTAIAMSLRSSIWLAIALAANRLFSATRL